MSKKIERIFLLNDLPHSLSYRKKEEIRQGYLSFDDRNKVHIRQKGARFSKIVKTGSKENRKKIKTELSQKEFKTYWHSTGKSQLVKTRYHYSWEGYKLMVDQFHGRLEGLFTAEIEFKNERKARQFMEPPFFREEISFDPRYKNHYLAELPENQRQLITASGISHSLIGTLPYIKEGERKKVILVTKKNGLQWIFPKGQQENRMTYPEVARMEAEEEAGIKGIITARPIRLPYVKSGRTYNLLAYPMEINTVLNNWQEMEERQRKIVSLQKAYKLSDQLSVHCGLQYLEQLI
ncbi:MAG: hypothetical protein B6241_04350 [Spirochaetaceae bacterium 4572_59]|nr:MAG: hypothetical protein B6241_04350 [Spirochaetaceae bacterium 4572_59]